MLQIGMIRGSEVDFQHLEGNRIADSREVQQIAVKRNINPVSNQGIDPRDKGLIPGYYF